MLILTLRTDKPEAEIGLYKADQQLAYLTWQAYRELAETIHHKIRELLEKQQKTLDGLNAIIVYKGPGSFTGLRIGVSVANALADSLNIPIVATDTERWIEQGLARLQAGRNDKIATPEYGAPVRTTTPKK